MLCTPAIASLGGLRLKGPSEHTCAPTSSRKSTDLPRTITFGASSLITRSTNDIQQIQTTVMLTSLPSQAIGARSWVSARHHGAAPRRQIPSAGPRPAPSSPSLPPSPRGAQPTHLTQQTRTQCEYASARRTGRPASSAPLTRQDFIRERLYRGKRDQLRASPVHRFRFASCSAVMRVISISTVGVLCSRFTLIDSQELRGSMTPGINYVGMTRRSHDGSTQSWLRGGSTSKSSTTKPP